MPICLYCGAEITAKSHKKGSVRKYCSKECYEATRDIKDFKFTICQYCGKTFKESRDRPNLYCSISCAGKSRARIEFIFKEESKLKEIEKSNKVIEHHQKLFSQYQELMKQAEEIRYRIEHEKACAECGNIFMARTSSQICCSNECSKRHVNRKKDKRIYKNGKPDLSISLVKVYKRDEGVCQICGRHLDFDCDPNSKYYPSIDHIFPIAKGGTHTWNNVQLACRKCNTIKCDNV